MKMRRTAVLVAVVLRVAPLSTTIAEAQMGSRPLAEQIGQVDQRALGEQLLGEDGRERSRALEMARAIGPDNMSGELRAALITTLKLESRVHLRRYEAGRRGELLPDLEDPEFIGRVSRVVAELRDPQAIPALAGALGIGFTVIRALAAFGEQAAPAVLEVVSSPESMYDAVNDGLITLRFMVEGAGMRPLTVGTLAQIRRVAEQHLNRPGRPAGTGTTLRWAIDLAVVLNDANLRRTVESLASNWNEVVARGVTDIELIEQTRKRAADRLAGIPPLPRP